MQCDTIPFRPGPIAPPQHRRIVPADLGATRAVGRCTIKVVQDERFDGVSTMVHARGEYKDAEGVFFRRVQPKLGGRTVNLGPDVHSRPGSMGRDKLSVESNRGLDSIEEKVDGDGRHRNEFGTVLQACGVAIRPEDCDPVFARQAKGFEPLIGLLAVVERRRHTVDTNVRVGDELERAPFSGFDRVMGFDVAIYCTEKAGTVSNRKGEATRQFGGGYPRERGIQHWTSQWC